VLLIVLGAWGGLVPFVGPYFDYQIGTSSTWDWSLDRLWLSVLPGAAVVLGGLVMLFARRRSTVSLGGLLALAGGAWFIAGPTVSMLWNDGQIATGAAVGGDSLRVAEWIGFFYGTGALITLLSAYELGFMAALPVTEPALAVDSGDRAATPTAPATTGSSPAPLEERSAQDSTRTRRRRFLRRPGRERVSS
jgi:hypothetical protein